MTLKHFWRRALLSAVAAAGLAGVIGASAFAADYTLKIQTHQGPETLAGKIFEQFVADVEANSGGRIDIMPYTSSSLVAANETFDAASTGILDGDMTTAQYLAGKDRAFQFFSDLMGGYSEPSQMYAWLEEPGNRELADELYGRFGMHLVGFWGQGVESLCATLPLTGVGDLQGWKVRMPPGMGSEVFERLGARPVVMAMSEIFTALSTGVVDGADFSSLHANKAIGLYDVCKYTTYPGFHSNPMDHLAINGLVWGSLPDDLKTVIEDALGKAATDIEEQGKKLNVDVEPELKAAGVTMNEWSEAELHKYRAVSQTVWQEWAESSDLARRAVDSHVEYMKRIGVLQ